MDNIKDIRFDSGERTYSINGSESRVIKVMITDLNLGKRLDDMKAELKKLTERLADRETNADSLYELDCEARRIVNEAIGSDVCTAAFGTVNCCSPVGGGRTLIQNFAEALAAQISSDIRDMKLSEQIRPEAAKYLEQP